MFDMSGMYLLLGGFLLIGAIFLGAWVLHAYALWRMAKWAGMARPWLAWVPFAQYYIQGSLCDRAIYFRTGRRWHLAVILPVLSLLAPSAIQIMVMEYLLPYSMTAGLYSFGYEMPQLLRLVFLAAATVGLYFLYCDYAPRQAGLYTVLSLIFSPVAPAVLLMVLRDRVPLSAGGYQPPACTEKVAWTTGPESTADWDRQPMDRNEQPRDPCAPKDDFSWRNGPER